MKYLKFLMPWWLVIACSGPTAPESESSTAAAASGNPAQAEASYIGEAVCVGCHTVENSHWSHTVHARVFRSNPRNPLEARVCEACHGPGSEHLTDLTDKSKIMAFTRNSGSTIAQKNAMCLQCSSGWPAHPLA